MLHFPALKFFFCKFTSTPNAEGLLVARWCLCGVTST